ncbi:MAG TPA: heavy metal translocating P-type ATPase, partial [Anaerovoracaceae bacterium]|nr:heavy metal translocating P-type ATPase [Anaerovoracaceae bacterium]
SCELNGCCCAHDSAAGEKKKEIKAVSGDEGCCCGGECEHEEEYLKSKRFLAGVALFIIGVGMNIFMGQVPVLAEAGVFLVAYLLIGKEILLTAGRNITKGKVFDENFLMAIASIGAFVIGEYPEAVAVMLFYRVGEYVQGRAVSSSRKSISALMDIRPDTANKKTADGIRVVPAEDVRAGDIIVIKTGEKVPLDGIITEGSSTMDTRALTGESLPRDVSVGSEVLSGSINGQGLLQVKVTKEFSESTASKIIELVQSASNKKAKTENFITKFAGYYTPAVVGIAVALAVIPPFVLDMGSFSQWLYRALVFLVISCPCALVISIPLGFFGGIGAASSKGILVKGSNYLEALNEVDTVIFDKTGTLTTGIFKVTEIRNQNGFTKDEILKYGAYAEYHSTHPIAVSIKNKYLEDPANEIREDQIAELTERAGFGVRAQVGEKTVLAGNLRLMEEEQIKVVPEDAVGTVVYIAVGGSYAGAVVIADEAKADSKKTIEGLHQVGVKKVAMLTGDSRKIGEEIGRELKIDDVYSELLPHKKVEVLESIFENRKSAAEKAGKVIFVGDGINDAPVLARADIGIAMGGVGSDAAIEAADIVIMNDEPSKVITAIRVARKTRTIVWQNIIGALGVKGVVLLLGALGFATMWEAVFADVGVAILAVLNAVRAGRIG